MVVLDDGAQPRYHSVRSGRKKIFGILVQYLVAESFKPLVFVSPCVCVCVFLIRIRQRFSGVQSSTVSSSGIIVTAKNAQGSLYQTL